MSNLQSYIDPGSMERILKNLGLAIDEATLVLSLKSLSNEVLDLESLNEMSECLSNLKKEILIAEVQLNYVRDQSG